MKHKSKKCEAKCEASQGGSAPFLWLRNDIFYYRIELPRVNGKRRYKRLSLHTNNYYEAKTLMEQKKQLFKDMQELRQLFNQLDFVDDKFSSTDDLGTDLGMQTIELKPLKIISSLNPKALLEKIWILYTRVKKDKNQLPKADQDLLSVIEANQKQILLKIENIVEDKVNKAVEPIQKQLDEVLLPKQGPPVHFIYEVIQAMLLKGNNCKSEQERKKNVLATLLSKVNLSVMDDYSKFHNIKVIEEIAKYVNDRTDVKGDNKRRQLRYIKELVTCASNIEPDYYKVNVIANLPNIEKTKKAERKPHLPYTENQLLEMFDPKHDFFKKNPDVFWICMVALFTGARQNAACTLQYDDVVVHEGLNCIHFIENHPLKQLKNDASERFVPIHDQLLDLGFVDYVNRKKAKMKATGSDFIFPKCQTSGGIYNSKYLVRTFSKFLTDIKIKQNNYDGYDFHSFRKNASLIMQAAHIPESFINDIVGWNGSSIMTQSYSNHTLAQIKEQMDTFEYDFLETHFATWKTIMLKKP